MPATPTLPVESYIYWLLYEVPLPPAGRSLKLHMSDMDIICQRPGTYELPFFDYPLRHVFELISMDTFLKIYTCVLLEHQILLCSKVLQKLMLLAESLTSLLFPFRWQHVYVPILPYSQFMFLEAPLPFIMGLWYEDAIPGEVVQANICLVDIDSDHLELPEDMPLLPDKAELMQELYFVFDKYGMFETENLAQQNDSVVDEDQLSKNQRQFRKSRQNSNFRRNDYHFKRMSRSFDEDKNAYISTYRNPIDSMEIPPPDPAPENSHHSTEYSKPPLRSQLPLLPLNVLHESESLARLTALVKKVGVDVTLENLQREIESAQNYKNSPECQRYFDDIKFNNAVREIFANRFVYMLFSYDHFIIGNYNDKETFTNNRDSLQNFDKASFLSDQPVAHLPFLSAFLETQMFTSFVDAKILSQWDSCPDPYLVLFDERLKELRDRYGDALVRTPTYESCPSFAHTENSISKREERMDYDVPPPHALEGFSASAVFSLPILASPHEISSPTSEARWAPIFPLLRADLLNIKLDRQIGSPQISPWKQRYRNLHRVENLKDDAETQTLMTSQNRRSLGSAGAGASDLRAAELAQTNWRFVEQLLREAKSKTKRLLVEKMGKEAVELGHADLSLTGVEENTLVAAMCDMLERGWSHGTAKKKGKSALWAHLLALQEAQNAPEDGRSATPPYLTPAEAEENKNQQQQPHAVLTYLQNLQKEMGQETPWSTNLLKAASFICDKLQSNQNSPMDQPVNLGTLDPLTRAGNIPSTATNVAGRRKVDECPSKGDSAAVANLGFMGRLRRTGSNISLLSDFSPWNNTSNMTSLSSANKNGDKASIGNYCTLPHPRSSSTNRSRDSSENATNRTEFPSENRRSNSLVNSSNLSDVSALSSPNQIRLKSNAFDRPTNWNDEPPLVSGRSQSLVPTNKNGECADERLLLAAPPIPRPRSVSRPRPTLSAMEASSSGSVASPSSRRLLRPLPTHVAYDMRNVVRMTEIKTDIGLARAFVRLALERKLLHKHLKALLSNEHLLECLYKRYAFLRCDEEREQLLCHILSLNAADFYCFTNTFSRTEMTYQMAIVSNSGRSPFSSLAQPNSLWFRVGGTLNQTNRISAPRNATSFTFDHKNLGVLSTLRIGHSTLATQDGISVSSPSKWFLDFVLIRNEITGRTYRFPCGRWFGRGVDDGSLERLLFAEAVKNDDNSPDSYKTVRTPPRSRSPSMSRRGTSVGCSNGRIDELQQKLGDSVNNVVKHFYKQEKDGSHLTPLLCGDRGLIRCIEQAFLFNFKTSRLFRHVYPWDFAEKFALWCLDIYRDRPETIEEDSKRIMRYCFRLITKINTIQSAGKDAKFQTLMLVSLRDHALPALISLMANSTVAQSMYDEPCFLRTPRHRVMLTQLLSLLSDFHFELEESLTWGIKI